MKSQMTNVACFQNRLSKSKVFLEYVWKIEKCFCSSKLKTQKIYKDDTKESPFWCLLRTQGNNQKRKRKKLDWSKNAVRGMLRKRFWLLKLLFSREKIRSIIWNNIKWKSYCYTYNKKIYKTEILQHNMTYCHKH